MKVKNPSIVHKMTQAAQVPKDLADGAVLVTVTGQEEICVENYRGIIEYTDTCLLLQAKHCRLEIQGRGLCINYYTCEEMKIVGHIQQIRYV